MRRAGEEVRPALRARAQRSRGALSGRPLAAFAATLFGTQGVLAHWYAAGGGQTASLVALRFIVGGTLFGAIAVITRLGVPARRELIGAVLTGLGQVVFTTCLLRGFATSSVALTVLLFYTYPLFVTLGAAALYGEPLTRGRIALVGVGSLGVALAVGHPSGGSSGVLYGLGAAAVCTCVTLGNRGLLVRGLTVPQLAATAYFIPTVVFTGLLLAGVIPLPPATTDVWEPAIAYLCFTVTAYFLFYEAVARVGASLASLIATLEPLVGVLLAWLLIDEALEPLQLVGGALIIGAVATLSRRAGKAEAEAEVLVG